MDAATVEDLDLIVDKMLDDKYLLKRGETYGYGNVVSRDEYNSR